MRLEYIEDHIKIYVDDIPMIINELSEEQLKQFAYMVIVKTRNDRHCDYYNFYSLDINGSLCVTRDYIDISFRYGAAQERNRHYEWKELT